MSYINKKPYSVSLNVFSSNHSMMEMTLNETVLNTSRRLKMQIVKKPEVSKIAPVFCLLCLKVKPNIEA